MTSVSTAAAAADVLKSDTELNCDFKVSLSFNRSSQMEAVQD